MVYVYIIIINIILLFSFYIFYKRKISKQSSLACQQAADLYVQRHKKELEERILRECENLQNQKNKIGQEIEQRKATLISLEEQINFVNRTLDKQQQRAISYEKDLRNNAEQIAKTYEAGLLKIAEQRVASEKEGMIKAAQKAYEEEVAQLYEQASKMREQIQTLSAEVEAYSAKQAAIKEAILRQRALEEQQDFYRVCLTPEAISDIAELQIVRQKLKKPEIFDKIIYDTYVAKPVLEMIKRVLQNSTCSGIYKITCQKTKEIYIGKSTDVKNRWQQHCKTAFNCGTIASSILHRKMQQYGIENFTFELLESVPKDQLSEREKFYINFYKSKEVGLNERNG